MLLVANEFTRIVLVIGSYTHPSRSVYSPKTGGLKLQALLYMGRKCLSLLHIGNHGTKGLHDFLVVFRKIT